MKLVINSPIKKKSYDVTWVECNSTEGNMIIQPQHAPMIAVLKEKSSVVFGLLTGKRESVVVQAAGIVHVTRDSVMVLLAENI